MNTLELVLMLLFANMLLSSNLKFEGFYDDQVLYPLFLKFDKDIIVFSFILGIFKKLFNFIRTELIVKNN
jgi:hypothetical protein